MEQNSSRRATSIGLFKTWLIDWLARELGIEREKIDASQSFLGYGMDSVQAMTMVGDLEANLEVRLPPTLAWDFPGYRRPVGPPRGPNDCDELLPELAMNCPVWHSTHGGAT